MILDTTFVIDLLNNKDAAVSMLRQLEKEGLPYSITTPTIFELWGGLIFLKKAESERQKTANLLKEQIIYDLDQKSAKEGGKIDGELALKGLTIDPEDCMIAGIAITNNKKILTRDEHFSRIERLNVENY